MNETVIGVACGDGQTIVVTTLEEVWGWGCYKDKEGKKFFNPSPDAPNPMRDIKKQQNVPIKIMGLVNIVEIACGASCNMVSMLIADVDAVASSYHSIIYSHNHYHSHYDCSRVY